MVFFVSIDSKVESGIPKDGSCPGRTRETTIDVSLSGDDIFLAFDTTLFQMNKKELLQSIKILEEIEFNQKDGK